VLAQTRGKILTLRQTPGFDIDTALDALNITRTPFDEINGNIQGLRDTRIAVSPSPPSRINTPSRNSPHRSRAYHQPKSWWIANGTAVHIRRSKRKIRGAHLCETLGLDGADSAVANPTLAESRKGIATKARAASSRLHSILKAEAPQRVANRLPTICCLNIP